MNDLKKKNKFQINNYLTKPHTLETYLHEYNIIE